MPNEVPARDGKEMIGFASRLVRASGDQGRERMRRVYLSALTSIGSRIGSIGVLLLTVPIAQAALGPERFGMWMVISSIGAVMAFADLGIGNGIINLVAAASGRDDITTLRTIASSAFLVLGGIALVLAFSVTIAYPLLDWASVFRVTSRQAVDEAGPSILLFVLCFAIGLPASVGPKMQIGLQQSYIANLWIGGGGMLSLIAVLVALWSGAGVPMLVLAMFGSQQLALLGNTLLFFAGRRDLAPARGFISLPVIRRLFRLGISFFALQFVAVIVFRLDALFVTQFFGPAEAGIYATIERIFSMVAMLVGLYLAPLWPAYGEAASRGDYRWIIRTLRRSTLVAAGGSAVMGLGIVLLHPWVLGLLLNHPVDVPILLLAGFAVMKICEAVGNALSMFLNGLGVVDAQILFAVVMSAAASILKLTIAQDLGIASLIWITVGCYAVFSILPALLIARRTLGRLP